MNVDDVVAEKIAAARARAEETKRQRTALAANRQRGLALRHAQRLRNQANRGDMTTAPDLRGAEDHAGMGQSPTTVDLRCPDGDAGVTETVTVAEPDDVVVEVTEAEFHASAAAALARLGLTYAELEDQARRRDFVSAQAHSLWVSIGGTVNIDLLKEDR